MWVRLLRESLWNAKGIQDVYHTCVVKEWVYKDREKEAREIEGKPREAYFPKQRRRALGETGRAPLEWQRSGGRRRSPEAGHTSHAASLALGKEL